MFDVLQQLCALAEREDIYFLLEPLNTKVDHEGNFLSNTAQTAAIIQYINSERMKILYDMYHMQIMEGDIIDTLKKYMDVIGYIHIADVPGRHEPGTGEINYSNVIQALKDLNYEHEIGFELFPLDTSEKAVQAIHRLFE